MQHARILIVGRSRNDWLEQGVQHYLRRMQHKMQVETRWLKDDLQLLAHAKKETVFWCLDPQGALLTSEALAAELQASFTLTGGQLSFIIGGAEGLSPPIRQLASRMLSLSRLTFPHLLCRLLLVEQLYRSLQIWSASPYHKGTA